MHHVILRCIFKLVFMHKQKSLPWFFKYHTCLFSLFCFYFKEDRRISQIEILKLTMSGHCFGTNLLSLVTEILINRFNHCHTEILTFFIFICVQLWIWWILLHCKEKFSIFNHIHISIFCLYFCSADLLCKALYVNYLSL